MKPDTTGRLHLRYKGTSPLNDGRQLIMVVGVIAAPPGRLLQDSPNPDEAFYAVVGLGNNVTLIHNESFEDSLTEYPTMDDIKRMRADQILTSPLWQV